MSARQVFIPRPSSCVPPSDTIDTCSKASDETMFGNGNGKARSITAFLGQRRGGINTTSKGAGLGQANTNTNRRSFEGIMRPEMTPMSIIPYPMSAQAGAGIKQPGAVQTPRKTPGPGAFEFTRPVTPESVPRGLRKGLPILAENQQDGPNSDKNERGTVLAGPGCDPDARIGAGTGIGDYMRVFEGSGGGRNARMLRPSLERDVAAPVPGYALRGLGTNQNDEGSETEGIFARSSRSLGVMAQDEDEASIENNNDQRNLGGMKRGMRHEDVEDNGRYASEGHHTQEPAKRLKPTQHDPNGYFPISSPHIPPTPGPPASSVSVLDPSLIVGPMFENMEEFVSLDAIEADWKRWKECTTDEWLKGTDELAQDYTDTLNMVKDYLTERVLAFASMMSSVAEKQTEVDRNIATIHGKGITVQENISKLGTKK